MTENNDHKDKSGILSDQSLKTSREEDIRQDVKTKKDLDIIISSIEKEDWNYKKLIIYPYNESDLSPYTYDLRIGDCIWSLFDRETEKEVVPLIGMKEYSFEPGNTIVVLTKEYVIFPDNVAGRVSPRFSFVYNGIIQSMVKIDPTWYGKLAVCLTNQSNRTYPLLQDTKFW